MFGPKITLGLASQAIQSQSSGMHFDELGNKSMNVTLEEKMQPLSRYASTKPLIVHLRGLGRSPAHVHLHP